MDTLDFHARATISVVDDTPDNLALMSALLKDAYKVKVANCYVFRSPRSEALAHTANGEALRSSRS